MSLIIVQLHLYSGEVSEVYEHIPPKCLPKDFGGQLDSVADLHGNKSYPLFLNNYKFM